MTAKQMERFTQHCDKCFRQKNDRVLHSAAMNDLHIDILLYEPTEEFP